MPAAPPVWSEEQVRVDCARAEEKFRDERLQEPLERYLEAFEHYEGAVRQLLDLSDDLSELEAAALEIVIDDDLLYALRYLPGPPISKDDLQTLADARLSARRLRDAPEHARAVVQTVALVLDRRRFPWVAEARPPTQQERDAAVLASAVLIASQRVRTARANEAKQDQEGVVKDVLREAALLEVPSRTIRNVDDFPARGEFCGESLFGARKADVVVRLWDGRIMPTECKVSNSSTNSVKRLNNDAAVKARQWLEEWGNQQTIPVAVLGGVFKAHNVLDAQRHGLAIFWAHSLEEMITFIGETRD